MSASTTVIFRDASGAVMELGPDDREEIFLSIRGPDESAEEDRVYSLSREDAAGLIAEIAEWLAKPKKRQPRATKEGE